MPFNRMDVADETTDAELTLCYRYRQGRNRLNNVQINLQIEIFSIMTHFMFIFLLFLFFQFEEFVSPLQCPYLDKLRVTGSWCPSLRLS